jgi:hypothetical protein
LILTLLYAEEDWRGSSDWMASQRDLAAEGETLDLRQLAPPGKPEDDLSKVPIFAPLYKEEPDANAPIQQIDIDLKAPDSITPPRPSQYLLGKPLDLKAWQKFYRSLPQAHLSPQPASPAQDVLQALTAFDPQLSEIRKALDNPNAYWPTNYGPLFETRFGGITRMISVAKVLQLQAIAHLENGEADLAERDYLFSFRLHQPLTKRCFLVDYLVMLGVRAIDDSILWEGLRRHAWNDTQLREMESALASTDMLALAGKAIQTERAQEIRCMKFVQNGHYDLLGSLTSHPDMEDKWATFEILAFLKCRPSGWGTQGLVFLNNEMQKQIDAIDLSRGTLDPSCYKNWPNAKKLPVWIKINFFMPVLLMVPYEKLGEHIAKAETYRRLARLACRLEEYRLAHSQYPDKLDDLPELPPHLDQEVLSEQPLHYQRKGDDYLLYSVGWNQKDDGGTLDAHNDERKGDWPWPSP